MNIEKEILDHEYVNTEHCVSYRVRECVLKVASSFVLIGVNRSLEFFIDECVDAAISEYEY